MTIDTPIEREGAVVEHFAAARLAASTWSACQDAETEDEKITAYAAYAKASRESEALYAAIREYDERVAGDRLVVWTDAPEAYDYGYTIELESKQRYRLTIGQRRTLRRVSIPEKRLSYQCGRYGSGLYVALESEQFTAWLEDGAVTQWLEQGVSVDEVES